MLMAETVLDPWFQSGICSAGMVDDSLEVNVDFERECGVFVVDICCLHTKLRPPTARLSR